MRKPQRSCVALMKICFPNNYETHARGFPTSRGHSREGENTRARRGADRCARSRKHDGQPRSAGRNSDNSWIRSSQAARQGCATASAAVRLRYESSLRQCLAFSFVLRRGRGVHRTRCVVPMLAVRVHPVNVIPCKRGFTLPAASHERRLSVFLRREPFSRDAKRSSCIGNDCLRG